MMNSIKIILVLLMISLIVGCTESIINNPLQNSQSPEAIQHVIERESAIPSVAIKVIPKFDVSPPQLHSDEWNIPVPLDYPINTAGAEDSPFITPDGNTLYFFFTPDPNIPVEKQLFDKVTGIYISHKQNGNWSKPERVKLQDSDKLSLDGCEYVHNNLMWFCSAREGYEGLHWFTAEYTDSKWQDWKNSDFNSKYKVGELHFINEGNTVYFHSNRDGGKGNLDLWVSRKVNGQWLEPENLASINSERDEGWPFVNEDETELWFYRDYGIWRSKKINGEWSKPESIISSLAGEPSLDNIGNIYFVHHYFKEGKMLEADIYVAYKK